MVEKRNSLFSKSVRIFNLVVPYLENEYQMNKPIKSHSFCPSVRVLFKKAAFPIVFHKFYLFTTEP